MASSSPSHLSNYAVFLSFRGEDTRKTFVDHLYTTLMNRRILTFKDDENLRQGEHISPSLFNAIERSQIALLIFSKNYADSSWCLEELTHIMKCKDEGKLTVIPIFYDVVPSDVRKQEGDFGKGFAKQEARNSYKAEIWRNALICACEIAGWDIKNMANGHESRAMNQIVDEISEMVVPVTSDVGRGAPVQELIAKLEMGTDGVRMIGMWRRWGTGKTTLEGHCTLEDNSGELSKHGLIPSQKKIKTSFLKKVEELEDIVNDIDKIILILDNVDDDQVKKEWNSFVDNIEDSFVDMIKDSLLEIFED